jgi:hypothetical protein
MQLDDRRLLILGGIDRRTRFNDAWLFDAATDGGKGSWARIDAAGPAPSPRAHFSATRCGERVFVFGGYGGGGQVFADLWVLHCAGGAFRWEDVTPALQGDGAPPRFDHAAFVFPVTPNSETFDKLAVVGGRDLGQVLGDAHVLDLATMTWEPQAAQDAAALVPPPAGGVCCAAIEDVESVPYHKVRPAAARVGGHAACGGRAAREACGARGARSQGAAMVGTRPPWSARDPFPSLHAKLPSGPPQVFSFGGKKGIMSYLNNVQVLDCGSHVWSSPPLEKGCKLPCGRCARPRLRQQAQGLPQCASHAMRSKRLPSAPPPA